MTFFQSVVRDGDADTFNLSPETSTVSTFKYATALEMSFALISAHPVNPTSHIILLLTMTVDK
jgi:hypothetical protein